MGWLLKLILFFVVASWIFRGVTRVLMGGMFRQAQQRQTQQSQRATPPDGNVHVDYAPKSTGKNKSSDNFKGGDYVDYEELKD